MSLSIGATFSQNTPVASIAFVSFAKVIGPSHKEFSKRMKALQCTRSFFVPVNPQEDKAKEQKDNGEFDKQKIIGCNHFLLPFFL